MLLFVVASWFMFAYNCLMAVYKTCCLQMFNCCLNFKWFKVFINCRVNLLNDCTKAFDLMLKPVRLLFKGVCFLFNCVFNCCVCF